MLAGAAAARPLAATCMRRAGGRGAVSCRAQAPDAAEGGEEEDTSDTEPGWRCERSGRVAGEFMLFVFGTQLAVAEQRSLNEGAYEVAKAVRERQEEINALVSERKSSPGSLRAVEGELMDRQARCAVLRNQLDAAVREERYRDAAGLRDQLNDAESFLAATAAAPGAGKPVFAFTLGQRVQHSRWGWVGTVAGCEAGCSEGEEWSARVGLGNRGREQPFYVCLPDAACIDGATEVRAQIIQHLVSNSTNTRPPTGAVRGGGGAAGSASVAASPRGAAANGRARARLHGVPGARCCRWLRAHARAARALGAAAPRRVAA